jgi:biopolymer transport protein ExbD
MYNRPSARRRKREAEDLNLVPILDAVFILIFFLLFSAEFVRIREIGSDLPILTEAPAPSDVKKEEPLNLTLRVYKNRIDIVTGINEKVLAKVGRQSGTPSGYNLEKLHNILLKLKEKHPKEYSIIIEPFEYLGYEILVLIMDQVRFVKTIEEGQRGPSPLFNQIVFGNLAGTGK